MKNLFLNFRSLGEKLGFTPEKKETKPKKEKSAPGSATSSVKGSPTKKVGKGGKKKNPWETDSDESEEDENGFVSDSADEVILNLSVILSKLNQTRSSSEMDGTLDLDCFHFCKGQLLT